MRDCQLPVTRVTVHQSDLTWSLCAESACSDNMIGSPTYRITMGSIPPSQRVIHGDIHYMMRRVCILWYKTVQHQLILTLKEVEKVGCQEWTIETILKLILDYTRYNKLPVSTIGSASAGCIDHLTVHHQCNSLTLTIVVYISRH